MSLIYETKMPILQAKNLAIGSRKNINVGFNIKFDYNGTVNKSTGQEEGLGRRIFHGRSPFIEEGQFRDGKPFGYTRIIYTWGDYYEG